MTREHSVLLLRGDNWPTATRGFSKRLCVREGEREGGSGGGGGGGGDKVLRK
jgi:hypothetical protein